MQIGYACVMHIKGMHIKLNGSFLHSIVHIALNQTTSPAEDQSLPTDANLACCWLNHCDLGRSCAQNGKTDENSLNSRFLLLWDHKQHQGLHWEYTSTMPWFSFKLHFMPLVHKSTVAERFYTAWGVKCQITHGHYQYSLFSVTPPDMQRGRISLWISSPGAVFFFF